MDDTTEMILRLEKSIMELIASINSIRRVLCDRSLTTPQQLADFQVQAREEIRAGLQNMPDGQRLDSLLKQLSGSR